MKIRLSTPHIEKAGGWFWIIMTAQRAQLTSFKPPRKYGYYLFYQMGDTIEYSSPGCRMVWCRTKQIALDEMKQRQAYLRAGSGSCPFDPFS